MKVERIVECTPWIILQYFFTCSKRQSVLNWIRFSRLFRGLNIFLYCRLSLFLKDPFLEYFENQFFGLLYDSDQVFQNKSLNCFSKSMTVFFLIVRMLYVSLCHIILLSCSIPVTYIRVTRHSIFQPHRYVGADIT